jgi:hypothetical protein
VEVRKIYGIFVLRVTDFKTSKIPKNVDTLNCHKVHINESDVSSNFSSSSGHNL